ncbi:MAG: hypothetical protein ACP5N2_03335 [Candidatus Nanoarchaeia archaeon]
MSEGNLEHKIQDMILQENIANKGFPKKKKVGNTVLNVFAILGVATLVTYSAIKKKILGNPPSKIRKGLLYASLAAVILYKCQPDRIQNMYEFAKDRLVYEDQRNDLRRELRKKDSEIENKTLLLEEKQNVLNLERNKKVVQEYNERKLKQAIIAKDSVLQKQTFLLDKKEKELYFKSLKLKEVELDKYILLREKNKQSEIKESKNYKSSQTQSSANYESAKTYDGFDASNGVDRSNRFNETNVTNRQENKQNKVYEQKVVPKKQRPKSKEIRLAPGDVCTPEEYERDKARELAAIRARDSLDNLRDGSANGVYNRRR